MEVNEWNIPPFPNPDLGTVSIGGSTVTVVPFFQSTGNLGGAAVSFYFDNSDAGTVQCPPEACTGSVDVKLYARYGSVRGRVIRTDGTPAGGAIVAAYSPDSPGSALRIVIADANARYDFTADDAGFLFNQTREVSSIVFAQDVVTLLLTNNWGLPLRGDGKSPGRRTYALVAGSGIRPFSAPGQRIASLTSSTSFTVNLIADAETGTCPVDPLTPLTDPDAIDLEAGVNPVRFVDHDGNVRMDPSMLPDRPTLSQGRIACLQNAVGSLGGTLQLESAWRPEAYQDHFREIWEKWQLLKLMGGPECSALRTQILQEKERHGIGNVVGRRSAHTQGEAIDVRTDRPRPCTNCFNLAGPPGMTREVIDAAAQVCGLRRLPESIRPNDPGHFSIEGN